MFRFQVFKFIRIGVDGEMIENDRKTIVWTENMLSRLLRGENAIFKFIRISSSVDGTLVYCQNDPPCQCISFHLNLKKKLALHQEEIPY